MNPENIVFGFSIPRSADPQNIFDIMSQAATYCQKRLGGKLLDKNGQLFNVETENKSLMEIVTKMKNNGIEPGSDKALQMF